MIFSVVIQLLWTECLCPRQTPPVEVLPHSAVVLGGGPLGGG